MQPRNFEVYKLIQKDGACEWKRLPDYGEDVDKRLADAFMAGDESCRFTFKPPGGTKRQYIIDFNTMIWKRNSHNETGKLELLVEGLRLKRNIALQTRCNNAGPCVSEEQPKPSRLEPARPPGCLFPTCKSVDGDVEPLIPNFLPNLLSPIRPKAGDFGFVGPPGHLLPGKGGAAWTGKGGAACLEPATLAPQGQSCFRPPPGLEACCTVPPFGNSSLLPASNEFLKQDNQRLQNEIRKMVLENQILEMQLASAAAVDTDDEVSSGCHLTSSEAAACLGSIDSDVDFNCSDVSVSNSLQPNYTEGIGQQVRVEHSDESGSLWIHWCVDARKLHCKDKQVISPVVEVSAGIFFKIMLMATPMGDRRGQATWQKARGRGSVELKYAGDTVSAPALQFNVSVGSGERRQPLRGPVEHDFSSCTVGGLPKHEEEWDFDSAVDPESSSFLVSVEVIQQLP